MFEKVYSFCGDTFICVFVIHYKITIKHSIYFDIDMFLQHILHTLECNFTRIFEKLTRFDVLGVYYCQSVHDFRKLYLFRHLISALYPAPHAQNVRAPNLSYFRVA